MSVLSLFGVAWGLALVAYCVPILFAALGETIGEQSGVLNLGIEGMMLIGAFAAVTTSYFSRGMGPILAPILALVCATVAATVVALAHGYLAITRRGDQIVIGIGVNLLALGLTNVLNQTVFAKTGPIRVFGFPSISIPGLDRIPWIGPVLFSQSIPVYFCYALPFVVYWLLFRSSWGLSVRAAGELPRALDTAGTSVARVRYAAVLIAGALAGVGGTFLALGSVRYFTANMTAGRGFIALAAVVVGKWRPSFVVLACVLFSAAEALQVRLQILVPSVPYEILGILPYAVTLIAVAGFMGRIHQPSALMLPFSRGEAR